MTSHRIYFLTKQLDTELALFTLQLLNNNYLISKNIEVIIVEDATIDGLKTFQFNNLDYRFNLDHLKVLKMIYSEPYSNDFKLKMPTIFNANDEFCKNNGWYGCNIDGKSTSINKEVIAIDKMFLAEQQNGNDVDYIWVFEDDVFIPSLKAFFDLIDIKADEYDLICPTINEKKDKLEDWHWKHVFNSYKKAQKYYSGMMCAFGISQKLFKEIANYRHRFGKFFHHEAMIPCIAYYYNLKIFQAPALSTIFWKAPWSMKEFMTMPYNMFHPVKKEEFNHSHLRISIKHWEQSFEEITKYVKNNFHQSIKKVEEVKEQPMLTSDYKVECINCMGSGCRDCNDTGKISAKILG